LPQKTSFDLYAAVATPASAQEVVYNPGYCAQFYPNANCQNKAANSPYSGDYQQQIRGAYAWGAGPCAMGAEYYVGRGGLPLRLPLTGDRPQASMAPSGGYSLAIPVSLITRSYLAS